MNIRFVFFGLVLYLLSFTAGYSYAQNAQTNFTSEKEIAKQAEVFFTQENYVGAKPLFSQLLSLHPNDVNYTFKFGVCEIYASKDKSLSIQWLEKATQAPNAELNYFYYLGLAYHLNYRFNDAIDTYTSFLKKADKKTLALYPAQRQIDMCNHAKQLLVEVQDLVVVESKEVKRDEFYKNYIVRQDAGKLIIKPDEFKSSLDMKEGESSIIFFPKENPVIFYSSYGEDKSKGKDIFKVSKLPNGAWSKPENLGTVVNTPEDEDFSYVTPDGLTLFFCSKGHNSIGGYDVFRTTREENSNNWTEPINMGFAINSPDDDILYVADPEKGVAYFATTRQSVQSMIVVHKLNIDEKPLENVIIKGKFAVDADPNLMDAKITIFTLQNDEVVGEFSTKKENGDYLLIVPAGQKYKMVVNADGMEPLTQMIEVPVQKKAEAMGQKINISKIDGKDSMVVVNDFFGLVKNSDRLLDSRVLKEQAQLMALMPDEEIKDTAAMVSNEQEATDSIEEAVTNAEKTPVSKNVSDNELVNIAYDDAKKSQKEAEEYKENADIAYYLAQKRSETVAKQTDVIDGLEEKIKKASGNASQKDMDDLKKMKQQATQCGMEAKVAFNIAKKMETEANVTQKEAELTLSFAKELETASKSSSDEKAIKLLEDQKKKLEDLDKQRNANNYSTETMRGISNNKLSSAKEAKEKARKLQEETVNINSQVQKLKQDIESTQDAKQKDKLQKQLETLEKTEQESELKAQTAFKLAKDLENEAGNLNQEAELISDVLSEINIGYGKNNVSSQKIDKTVLNEQIQEIQNKTIAYVKEEDNAVLANNSGYQNTNEQNTKSEEAKLTSISQNDSALAFEIDTVGLNSPDSILVKSFQEYYKAEQLGKWISLIQGDITAFKDSLKTPDNKNRQDKIQTSIKSLEQLVQEKQVEKQEIAQEAATIKFSALSPSATTTKLSKKEEKERDTKYEERKQQYFKTKGFALDKPLATDTANSAAAYKNASFYKKQSQFYNREIADLQNELDKSNDPEFKKDADHKIRMYHSLAANKFIDYERYSSAADSLKRMEEELKKQTPQNEQLAENNSSTSSDSSSTASIESSKKADENIPTIKLPPISRRDFTMEDVATEVEKAKNFDREAKSIQQEADMIGQNIENITDSVLVRHGQHDIDSLEKIADYQRQRADTCQARVYMMKQLVAAEIKAKNDSIQKTIEVKTEKKLSKKEKKAKESFDLAQQQKAIAQARADSIAAIIPLKTDTTNYSNEAERLEKQADYYAEVANNSRADAEKLRAQANELRQAALATDDSKVKETTLKKVMELEDKANAKNQQMQDLLNTSSDYKRQAKEEYRRSGDTLNLAQQIQGNKKFEAILGMYENAYKKDKDTENTTRQQEYLETMAAATKDAEVKEKLQDKASDFKTKANALYEQTAKAYYDANKELYTINKTNLKKIAQKSFNNSEIMMANLLEDEINFYNKKVDSLNAIAANTNDPEKLNPLIQEMIKDQKIATEKQKKAGEIYYKLRQDTSLHQVYFSANDFINEAAKHIVVPATSLDSLLAANNSGKSKNKSKDKAVVQSSKLESSKSNTENNNGEATNLTSVQSSMLDSLKSKSTTEKSEANNDVVQSSKLESSKNETSSNQKLEMSETKNNSKLETKLSPEQIKLLQDPKIREVLNSEEYKNYKVIALEANLSKVEGQAELDNAKEWKDKSNEANANAKTILQNSDKIKDKKEAAKEVTKAEEQYKLAKMYSAKSDSVKKVADNIVASSVAKTNESELFLQGLDKITYQKIMTIKNDTALDNLVSKVMLQGNDITTLLALADNSVQGSKEVQSSKDVQGSKLDGSKSNTANNKSETNNTVQGSKVESSKSSNSNNKSEANAGQTQQPTTNNQQQPKNVVTNISKLKTPDYTFFTLNQSAYNASSPIPVDVKAPQGIYFMVQVGAFKNPIPQDLFKGITPVTGETTPQGVIRYSAGMFKTFESCNYAKNLIRGMGYGDAFVVAYIDGKRVSLQDALAKLGKLEGQDQLSYKQAEQLELNQLKDLHLPVTSPSEQDIKNTMANASDISKVPGLIYTVQIGVYSNPVTPDKLYNISPISYIKTSSGYIRYSTGQYKKFADADVRKNGVVKTGISDAFVTAYFNGDRIPIADAAQIESGTKGGVQSSTVQSSSAVQGSKLESSKSGADNSSQTTNTKEKSTNNQQPTTNNAIVFKVQMGAFKGDVAVKMVNLFLQFNSYGIEQTKNDNGYTIYTTGSFNNINDANVLKNKVVNAGISDAFVIAFNNGKRITVTEAVSLVKK